MALPGFAQEPLGSGSLAIRGTSLVVSPAAQTVPYDTPTEISTELAGFDTSSGVLPTGLRVRADLTGPEIDGVLALETTPGQPLRIPRLRLEGEYQVENIRLVEGDTVIQFAEPRDATVLVTQILVTRVSSRALTQDEIRSYGLVVNEDSFQGLNLTFGFAVSGRTIEYGMPLTYNLFGPGDNGLDLENVKLPEYGGGTVPSRGRFRPPQLTPFEIRLEGVVKEIPSGGCDVEHSECRKREPPAPPLVGVVLFPTDVSLLNQFFAVVLMVQNGAPDGDPLVVRDLFAKIQLPPGLRAASTDPPTPLGVPVPVRVPGPDGELGTGDDLHFLIAQAEGAAEFLVEGQREGTYLVDFEMQGVLDGLPTGPQPIFGSAKGAVVVRDPTLSVTISHPATVRNDEQYPLYLTVSNTGTAPVNQLSVRLPTSGLSGSVVIGSNEQTVPTLLPGDSEVVEFQLESRRTGRVVASSARADAGLSPRFDLQVGVGNGIPLSPESLALPSSVDDLPPELVRASMALVGLGHSLATAPPDLLDSDLPRLGRAAVDERIYRLAQAGRHVHLGEDTFDSVSILTQEWLGARDRDVEWDALRRQVDKGVRFIDAVADVLTAEESQPRNLFDRLAETTDFLEPGLVLVEGNGVTVEVMERGSGRTVGLHADGTRTRDLPFGEVLDLDSAKLAMLAAPDPGGHRLLLHLPSGGATSVRLTTRDPNGALRASQWNGVALTPNSVAWLDFGADGDTLQLLVDDDGDGTSERHLGAASTTVLTPRPFAAVSAVQNVVVDPSGHVVDVLFTQDVEISSLVPRDPGHFVVPGKVSNGGLIPTEADIVEGLLAGGTVHENPFEGLFNTRVVRVVFDNPLSPYVVNPLTIQDLDGTRGTRITSQTLPQVVTNAVHEGIQVEGTVFGPDGQPVPFAEVQLWERDLSGTEPNAICTRHVTAATLADAEGRYRFDYVRKGDCGEVFEVEGIDRQRPNKGTARGRIRFIGQTQTLDVRMVGRGSVQGQITFADGSVPDDLRVVVYHPILDEGRLAHVGQDGTFEVANIAVGTLNLAANDSEGNFLYATFEMPRAGASVEKNFVMVRQPEAPRAEVRGTILTLTDNTPLFDAYVALYVDGVQIGVQRSAVDGRFDFGIVPAGTAVLEAFDGTTGRQGDQLTLTLAPDQVQDVTLHLRDDRGTVEGNVFLRKIDGSTVPLADVVVFINGLPHNTTTDANGFYRLDDVFAGNWQVVAASFDLLERVAEQVTITSAGGSQTRDLYFQEQLPSGGITGQILDYDGQPVENATIHLSGDYYSVDWHNEATSGADGRFVIADLDPGVYGVHAFRGADGAIGFAEIRFPGDTPSVTVQFRKATVSGRTFYVDPATGAEIGVISQIVYRHTQVVTEWGVVALAPGFSSLQTDGDGNFTIPDVLVGPYELYVYNAFHGNKRFGGFIEDQNDDRFHPVEFTPNGTVTGVVYDWDGTTPVQGARVSMTGGQFGEFDLLTDVDGRFTFELVPPGNSYTLTVDTDDGLIFRKQRIGVQLKLPGQEVDVEVTMPRQGSVQGLVQTAPDVDGVHQPVPGAVVTLREGGYPWRTLVHNADENGIFAFENIFEGDITLEAQAPSLGGLGGRVVDEIHTEAQEVVTFIELEPVAEIAVRVLSPETGDVVPGARLELSRSAFYDTLSSDEEGSARFRLLPLGNYRVRVFDPDTGRRGLSSWIELEAGNQRAEVDIVLEIRGDVGGTLTDGNDGAELPGRVIKLRSQGLRWFSTYATTGVDGQFIFEGIPQGDFSLETLGPQRRRWARAHGFLDTEDELVTLDLVLEQTGTVTGRVLNPPGLPAGLWEQSDVNVWLDQGSWVVGASLDNPYSFGGVVADRRFVLRAQERGGLHRAVTSDVLLVEGGEKTVDLQFRAIGSAQVSVFDSNGQPVPGASVSVHNGHEFAFGGSNFSASTGSDHQVLFEDIREGTLWARATDPATGLKGSVSGRLALEGELAQLQIQLENSGSIIGKVVLSDGMTPAVGATVALSIRGRYYLLSAEEDGGFEFDTIPMGNFTFFSQELFGPGTIERTGSLTTNNQVIDFGTLVLDDEDPFVVSIDPPAGTRDVPPLSTAPVIVFSEPIQNARLSPRSCGNWFELRRSANNSWVNAWCDWSADGTTVTITPQQSLGSSTAYYVRITTNVIDLAGRHLPWNRRSTFYTADIIPPAVIDILPPNGADQVPVDSPIDILMSEPIRVESLSGTALQLDDLTTGASWSVTPDLRPGNRRIRLNPDVLMVPDRQMQVTIQGLSDVAGNVMPQPVVTTFWTPDETPPTLSWVSPSEGAAFTAGDAIAASVSASDNRGVASVAFEIGGWSWTLTEPPYDQTVPAPIVATTGPVILRATVTDLFGNTTEGTRTLDISPNPNTVPPSLTVDCLRAGDLVLAGKAIDIPIQVADDESIESVRLRVDGVEDQVVSPIFASSQDLVLSWAPPSDAAPSTSFVLAVEARDFAGNVTTRTVTVTTPATPPRQGGGDLDGSVDGMDLVLDEGTWTVLEPLHPNSLTLLPGARLVPVLGTADAALLDVAVSGRLQLRCGSAIDVAGLGYRSGTEAENLGGAPAWVDGSTPVAGGSHGGRGITHPGRAGAPGGVFDSVYAPRFGGGGGSATSDRNEPDRGHGGGVVLLEADEIVLDGVLDARGRSVRHFHGAGAGGSVHLQAQSLRGIGSIDASGGRKEDAYPTCTSFYGAGGGGRVALDIGTFDGFDPANQVRATGGTIRESCGPAQLGIAAPGTVFVRTLTDTYGHLRIDAGQPAEGVIPPATELPDLGGGLVDQTTIAGDHLWVAAGDTFLPRWLGVWVELEDGSGQSLGVFRVLDIDPVQGLLLENAATADLAERYQGTYRFDGVELLGGASISATDPLSGAAFTLSGEVGLNGEFTASELTVTAGATVRPLVGSELRFRVTGTMTVESGALIDVSGLGYAPGTEAAPNGEAPSWAAGSTPLAGGSHGGAGIPYPGLGGAGGEVFDSVYSPSLAGGGGSVDGDITNTLPKGFGGGVLVIEAGTLVLDGALHARGISTEHFHAPGAGGSIVVRADALSGAGTVNADGGAKLLGSSCFSRYGAAGGGRVALDVGSFSGFDPASQVTARGGTVRQPCSGNFPGIAAAGTIYTRSATDTYGHLRIDAGQPEGGLVPPATELPVLGSGPIGTQTADGADLWMTGPGTFHPRWLGVWVELRDAADSSLGRFEVVERSAAAGLRLAGAAAVTGATTYRGEYRFDSLTLEGNAGLISTDPVIGEQVVFDTDGPIPTEVVANSMVVKSGVRIWPQGNALSLRVSGTLEIEPGAIIDLSGLGYAPGTEASPNGEAPDWVSGSTPLAGGSHGGAGVPYPDQAGVGGEVFDSVYAPSLAGGGGSVDGDISNSLPKGFGGGVLAIEAGTLVLDGALQARGISTEHFHAPGAGGTIVVHADAMTGSGTIDVDGGAKLLGSSCFSRYGAGGGGRVALDVGSFSGFDPASQVTARGGTVRQPCSGNFPGIAGAGTIYTRSGTDVYGHLRIDAGQPEGGLVPPATELPALGSGSIDTQIVDGSDLWIDGAESFHPRWLGVWVELRDAADRSLGSFEAVERSAIDGLRLAGAATVNGATTYRGEYRFDSLTLEGNAGLISTDPVIGEQVVFEADGPVPTEVVASSMVVKSGVRIWPQGHSLNLQVSGELVVEPGAIIDVSGLGYAPGTEASPTGGAPDWVSGSTPLAGGSHGGAGVPFPGRSGVGGEVYDSVYAPELGGGGGSVNNDISNSLPRGYGAGVLTIEAGSLVLDGTLRARGNSTQHWHSAGAGGSILVRAGALTGVGTIDADGGNKDAASTCSSYYGSGGGGRVALDVGQFSGFDPATQVTAHGGTVRRTCTSEFPGIAGAGTIYTRSDGDTYGHLRVDGGQAPDGLSVPATQLPVLGERTLVEQIPEADGLWVRDNDPVHPRWMGVWVELLDDSGDSLGSYRVVARSATQGLLLEGAASVVGAVAFRGEYRFDSVTLAGNAGLTSDDPIFGGDVVFATDGPVPTGMMASSLVVKSGVRIWPQGDALSLEVSGTLEVEPGAIIDVSGLGYAPGTEATPSGGAPDWVSGSTPLAGGSHGGTGVPYPGRSGSGGEAYGSVYSPSLGGGGGAVNDDITNTLPKGFGGGVLVIEAGTLVLDGALHARGISTQHWHSAGAGGSIAVRAGSLTGAGTIDASGGAKLDAYPTCSSFYGAGGGGRVAVDVGSFSSFDPTTQVTARGGTVRKSCSSNFPGIAGAGTVYTRSDGDTYGHLRVDGGQAAGGLVAPATQLPVLGERSVVAQIVDGDGLWVRDDGPVHPRWMGVWVELLDASGGSLGSYRVVARSATQGLLLEGAGGVAGATIFRGEYRFDTLVLDGLATLQVEDPLKVVHLDLGGATTLPETVSAETLTVRAGVVVQSAGSQLHVTADTVVVETGASIDLSGRGYPGGTAADPVGGAPEGVAGAVADGGGSHGGAGAAPDGGTPGEVFDSVVYPELGGGGGAHISGAQPGGGGGVLVIEATEVVLDGTLAVLGAITTAGVETGGAGGTVRIHADILRGSGLINAAGGGTRDASFLDGAGGGGRIALWVDDLAGFDLTTQARVWGGAVRQNSTVLGHGAPGTVFVFDADSIHGDLVVPAYHTTLSWPVLSTQLPELGSGTVGAVAVDAAVTTDLWIEPTDPNQRFALGVLGMWARVDGVDYRVLDQTPDRRSLLLADAAGFVSVGDAFEGVYKFDTVVELFDAQVVTGDLLEIGGTSSNTVVTVDDVSVVESAGQATFTLTLTPAPTGDVAVAYQTVAETAGAGMDYVETSGTLTVSAGSTTHTVAVDLLDDTLDESAETFRLVLDAAVGASVGDGEAVATVLDDDDAPEVSIGDATVTEGDTAPVDLVFTLSLSTPSGLPVSVDAQTSDGTAEAGVDYVATQQTVHFAPGELEANLPVAVLADTVDEPVETLVVDLTNSLNATVLTGQGIGTLLDNDPPVPEIRVLDTSASEGEALVSFGIELSEAGESDFVVEFATRDLSAIAGLDYFATSGSLVVPAGITALTLPVALVDDSDAESEEQLALDLVAPAGTVLVDGTGVATLYDNDTPAEFVEVAAEVGLDIGQAKQGGFAFCDLDGDGDLDLLVNVDWNDPAGRTRLLFQEHGTYVDRTASHAAGLARRNLHRAALCGDITGDGWPDLLRNGLDRIEIYANGGPDADPPFSFGTASADGSQSPTQVIDSLASGGPFTEGLGLLDVELDGDLDLIVENDAAGMALLLNQGDGTLVEAIPSAWGLPTTATHGDYLAVADYDADGRVDVLARRLGGDDLYRNTDSGFVVEPSLSDETSLHNRGGVSFCDFDHDGDLDAFWTDAGTNQIWRNDAGTFVATGEPEASAGVTVGADVDDAACGDVDLDGDLDLFLSTDSGPGFLFLNQTPTGGALAFVADNRGIDLAGANGEAATFADIDLDGDLDLHVQVDLGPNQVWRNPTNDEGAAHYLAVRALRCLPGGGLRDDLGARVRLIDPATALPISPLLDISGGRGHGTQDPATVVVGLPVGSNQPVRVEVAFQGSNGQPGPVVHREVVPTDLVGYRQVAVVDCTNVDQIPVAMSQVLAYQAGIELPVTLEGRDPEGHLLSYEIVSGPIHGTLSGEAPHLLYTPGSSLDTDVVTFRVWDGMQPSATATVTLEPPLVPFSEAATSRGLDLGHGKQGGFVFCDVDADGDLDLMVNTDWNDPDGRTRLLFAEGGVYVDRTSTHAAGLARRNLHRSALCGDVTGDGWPDLIRNGLDRIEVYANGGPNATPAFSFGSPGIDGMQSPTQVIDSLSQGGPFTEGLGLLDANLDGVLDLLVENDERGMALLLGDGTGTLVEVDAAAWGLPTAAVHGDYLAVADYDVDGWVDFLARKQGGLDLYRNVGGTFVGEPSLDDETDLWNRGGVSFCDFDNDGDFDAFWTDAGTNQIWRNDGGAFVATGEPTASSGVALPGDMDDAACGDVDLDGDLDLFLTSASGPGYLFVNETPSGGALGFRRDNGNIDVGANGEAAVFADVDLDGTLDLYVQVDGGANQLWLGGATGESFMVAAKRCVAGAYRDDLGAVVRLFAADGVTPRSPVMEINGGRGHGTQDPARVHFGLPGGADENLIVEVRFLGDQGAPGPVIRQTVRPAEVSAAAPAGYRLFTVRDQEVCP